MSLKIHGNCWKFGDDVNTDEIFPQRHAHKINLEEISKYAMEGIDPEFSNKVGSGDIIVAGKNFGCGSSMEYAPIALKSVGIGAVVAISFARIFFRNAISLGLPVIESPEISEVIKQGDEIEILLSTGLVKNLTTGCVFKIEPIPDFIMEILGDGGLIPHLIKKLQSDSKRN